MCSPSLQTGTLLILLQDKENVASDSVAENDPSVPAKNKTQEVADKAKNYLSDKIPKERRDQTIWRLKKMIIEIQGHADCKPSFTLMPCHCRALTT